MKLNPFEDKRNEFNLHEVLICDYPSKVKSEYVSMFKVDELVSYEFLLKSIDSNIDWKIHKAGGYQGDLFFVAKYNEKVYFVSIGYGSCSGCDALMACDYDINGIETLRDDIKRDIREFESVEELLNWVLNSVSFWSGYKEELLEHIKNVFNVDFEILKIVKMREEKY